jgi:hypothetical protein
MYPEVLMFIVASAFCIGVVVYGIYQVMHNRSKVSRGTIAQIDRLSQHHPCIKPRIKYMLDENGGFLTTRNYTTIKEWCHNMDVAEAYDNLHKTIRRKASS